MLLWQDKSECDNMNGERKNPSHTIHSYIIKDMERMVKVVVFNTGAALLDAIVLAVVSKEEIGTYGYKITQDVQGVMEISESTLYPVLRRLQKDECLEAYNQEFSGRNRRYYKITEKGEAQLRLYQIEWDLYAKKITKCLKGDLNHES